MGSCLVHRSGAMFKAWINVQANPNATITATGSKKTYTAVADATTGIASILIKKKDAYKITSDCGASYEAGNNTTSVNVTKNKQTYTAQKVKLNAGYTSFAVRNDYGSNTLIAYWNGSKPSSYCTNYYVEEITSSGSIGKYTGTGTSYTINTSTTVNGYKETVTSGTLKIYMLTAFITINGKNYYGNIMTASGTATSYSSNQTIHTYKSSQTITVPTGCWHMTAYCVGGGGGGGGLGSAVYNVNADTDASKRTSYSGGGGGGGGYHKKSSTLSVTPGQTISIVIGSGGSGAGWWANGNNGGTTSITVNGTTISASGGNGGTHSAGKTLDNFDRTGLLYGGSGGNGGSGGGGGNDACGSFTTSFNDSAFYGGNGGSNGGNGNAGYVSTSKNTKVAGTGSGASTTYNGTVYSGGGGGGSYTSATSGGSGGGGVGAYEYGAASAGSANSGGGGGGGHHSYTGASGGSGIAFIQFAA